MTRTTVGALAVLILAGSGEPHQVSQSGRGAYEASLTPTGDGFAVAWYDTRDGHAEIYARLLDAEGSPTSPERRLTKGTDSAYEPDIQAINGNLAVASYEKKPANATMTACSFAHGSSMAPVTILTSGLIGSI